MRTRSKVALAVLLLSLGAAGASAAAGFGVLTVRVGAAAPDSGIHVHGRWSLTVHDRRGHVVARRTLENALTADGADTLDGLILGDTDLYGGGLDQATNAGFYGVVGGQRVVLDDGSNVGQGCHVTLLASPCTLEHLNYKSRDGDYYWNSTGSGNLAVHINGTAITMSGSVTPPVATTFTKVESFLKVCTSQNYPNNNAPNDSNSDCASETDPEWGRWESFTAKSISPLPVQAGQLVTVSFTLSFS